MSDRESSDTLVEALVRGLESLQNGKAAAAALVGCGPGASEPLRNFLLRGKPSGIFQPRQLAVETLAELGAKDALLEYVRQTRTITDPVVRFSEAAVESAAARALSRWHTEDVYETLKSLADRRLLPGLVEALGEFVHADDIPYFLWALGDDECREPAEQALQKLGQAAYRALIAAANAPNPSSEEEIPSSRIRRRKVLRILAAGTVSPAGWAGLRDLLNERDPEIAITCARIALECGTPADQKQAIEKLIEFLPRVNWFLKTETRSCLADHFKIARDEIEQEISRRSEASTKERSLDTTLRILVNLKVQVESRRDRKADIYARPDRA